MSYILTKLTLTTMRKNRNRTLSTSVGIILSVFFMTVIVFVNTAETNFSTNDVIVFYYGHAKVVKRVCATSGDFVEVRDDGVYINGRIIAVNNESYEIMQRTLESREYFVLGDNYAYSTDSRYFGVITSEQCIGRIVCSINFNH